jgi:hypothetical protein
MIWKLEEEDEGYWELIKICSALELPSDRRLISWYHFVRGINTSGISMQFVMFFKSAVGNCPWIVLRESRAGLLNIQSITLSRASLVTFGVFLYLSPEILGTDAVPTGGSVLHRSRSYA